MLIVEKHIPKCIEYKILSNTINKHKQMKKL
jgi:hypothetical protein